MAEFIAFIVMFIGGIYLLSFAQGLAEFQSVVFVAGILLSSLALAFAMRQRGSATRRKDNWSQDS
ncbi:MAG: hypothetical protein WA971_08625 [Microbacterium sp.]